MRIFKDAASHKKLDDSRNNASCAKQFTANQNSDFANSQVATQMQIRKAQATGTLCCTDWQAQMSYCMLCTRKCALEKNLEVVICATGQPLMQSLT